MPDTCQDSHLSTSFQVAGVAQPWKVGLIHVLSTPKVGVRPLAKAVPVLCSSGIIPKPAVESRTENKKKQTKPTYRVKAILFIFFSSFPFHWHTVCYCIFVSVYETLSLVSYLSFLIYGMCVWTCACMHIHVDMCAYVCLHACLGVRASDTTLIYFR